VCWVLCPLTPELQCSASVYLPWLWRHSVRIDDTHKENEDEQEKVEDPSITVVSSVALIGGELPELDFFWGIRHLSQFYSPGTTQSAMGGLLIMIPFTIGEMSNSIIMAWLHNKPGGSLLLARIL
jgi:hypothetical protein